MGYKSLVDLAYLHELWHLSTLLDPHGPVCFAHLVYQFDKVYCTQDAFPHSFRPQRMFYGAFLSRACLFSALGVLFP